MRPNIIPSQRVAAVLALVLASASAGIAQTRPQLTIPTGSVIMVRTTTPLQSATASVGQTFETTVEDTVSIEGYAVIPAGSTIRGVVSFVTPADRTKAGVMQVAFNRLTMPDGTTGTIVGKLTSTDPTERRQIDARSDSRVVLVGGRGGIGAAIAGAGSDKSPAAGILAALGNLLSEPEDVDVPASTVLAVQLERPILLRSRGAAREDESTIYTKADRITAAQRALAAKGLYRGAINGQLDYATRRALYEYQIANSLNASGNLDGRTAQSLGLAVGERANVMTPAEAVILRRAGAAMVTRLRTDLRIGADGRMDPRRDYTVGEVDLLFAMSAFSDNAALYEQIVRVTRNANGDVVAGRALVAAALRVDTAMEASRPSPQVETVWASVKKQLQEIDPAYR